MANSVNTHIHHLKKMISRKYFIPCYKLFSCSLRSIQKVQILLKVIKLNLNIKNTKSYIISTLSVLTLKLLVEF